MTRIFLALIVCSLPLAAQRKVHLTGSVTAGQSFRKEIGSGLFFVLTPEANPGEPSWQIEVQPADGSDNYARCVTFSLHGPTALDLLAFQFVTESNEKLPEAELSASNKREFQFVMNAADQKKACAEIDVIAYGPRRTDKDGNEIVGTPGYQNPPLGSVTFLIRTMQMSDLGPGRRARFVSLGFATGIRMREQAGSPQVTE